MSYKNNTQDRSSAEDEISLIDLFLIVWKRKWMIVIVTLLVTVGAAGISFVLPEVYEITAIIEPAKDANGKPVKDPQNLRDTINAGVFDAAIAQNLDLPIAAIPQFRTNIPQNTSLVRISVESPEAERTVLIVKELLKVITTEIVDSLTTKIQDKIVEILFEENRLLQQIELTTKQLKQVEESIFNLETGRKEEILNSADKSIALLLYVSELTNQRKYAYDLREKLANLIAKKEGVAFAYENIRLDLESIEGAAIHKQPSVPGRLVKPKKPLIIAMAFVLSFLGSIMLAFVGEFIASVRRQQQQNDT